MKKIIIFILSICALATGAVAVGNIQPTTAAAAEKIIYVASTGSDSNDGSNASPYATLDKALTEVENGGKITLKDTITLNEWAAHGKTVTITGGVLDVSGIPTTTDSTDKELKEVVINDSVTFQNISWTIASAVDTYIYANGYKTTIGEGVSYSQDKVRLFGGGKENTTVASTDLTVLSGTYNYIYGGSLRGTVTGNTNLTVGGTVNNNGSDVDYEINSGHAFIYSVLGGGHVDTVKGSTNLVFQDAAKAVYVAGGAYGWGGTIAKGTNVTVTGGTIMGVYGSCLNGGHATSGASVRVEGGTMQQVFGGSEGQIVTGNVDVRLLGGTITRRVYAGSYGNGTKKYVVSGKINLELGGNVNITFGASQSDKGIYGRSRYNVDDENCQIVFTSEAAYNAYKDKLGGQDWGATSIMGSIAAADEYHYYTYTESDNVITQTCAYHDTLAATATLGMDENVSLQYTGSAIKPATLTFSGDWEYDKPAIAYENNIEIGKAKYSVVVGGLNVEKEFVIVDTPVVLGGSVRTSASSGLRFQSKIDANLKNSGATFGTLLIPKEVLGENELTVNTATVNNIQQKKWATDSVKTNNPEQYEEGFEYFNAVLTEIPEEHYDKVIVARSYVYANGKYYYSEPVERSIAQVASYALQDKYTDDILYEYVDKALENVTVTMETAVKLFATESYQLTLTGNMGYVAIWSSSDENVATVDKNGNVTAKQEGKATITAKLGNKTVQCVVTVKQWTGYY